MRGTAPEFVAKINAFGGEEIILDRIADGSYMQALAKEIGVNGKSFHEWAYATPEREKLVKEAQRLAAAADAKKAEQVLLDLEATDTPAQIARARELASHYRWSAKMRDRKTYGDQAELLVKTEVSELSDEQLAAERISLERQLGLRPAVGETLQ